MADKPESTFLVNASSDPIILKIQGRANYLNCAPISRFFEEMTSAGKRHIVVDFEACTGMDSTFLGIIAGAALEMQRQQPPGTLTLCRLGERNLELIRNLGLHRLVKVDSGEFPMSFDEEQVQPVDADTQQQIADARTILKAHENLVETDKENANRFEDVLSFLKKQVEEQ